MSNHILFCDHNPPRDPNRISQNPIVVITNILQTTTPQIDHDTLHDEVEPYLLHAVVHTLAKMQPPHHSRNVNQPNYKLTSLDHESTTRLMSNNHKSNHHYTSSEQET